VPGIRLSEGKPLNDLTKNILLWVVILMVMVVVFSRYVPTGPEAQQVSYSAVLDEVRSGRVESITLRGEEILGVRKDKSKFKAYNPETDNSWLLGQLDKEIALTLETRGRDHVAELVERLTAAGYRVEE
jgi:cell division protease FtsH